MPGEVDLWGPIGVIDPGVTGADAGLMPDTGLVRPVGPGDSAEQDGHSLAGSALVHAAAFFDVVERGHGEGRLPQDRLHRVPRCGEEVVAPLVVVEVPLDIGELVGIRPKPVGAELLPRRLHRTGLGLG